MRDSSGWSVSLGRWGGLNIRLHLLFLVFATATLFLSATSKSPPDLAYASLAVLFLSVLLHELGHYLAAARIGGGTRQIVLVPFGGLEPMLLPPGRASGELGVHLAGPCVNLLTCAASGVLLTCVTGFNPLPLLHPLEPIGLTADNLWGTALRLTFWINWVLFIINLLPVFPFDGGHVLRAAVALRWPHAEGRWAALFVSWLAKLSALAILFLAVFLWEPEATDLVPAWFALTLLAMLLYFSGKQQEPPPENELDRILDDELSGESEWPESSGGRSHASPGVITRWMAERRAARLERHREQEAADERSVDEILDRLHHGGMECLSEQDRSLLERVSQRYRDRQSPHS